MGVGLRVAVLRAAGAPLKVSFEEELLIVIFKYNSKTGRIACKMAVKFISNSHRILNLHNFTKSSLELVIIVIIINVVISW